MGICIEKGAGSFAGENKQANWVHKAHKYSRVAVEYTISVTVYMATVYPITSFLLPEVQAAGI